MRLGIYSYVILLRVFRCNASVISEHSDLQNRDLSLVCFEEIRGLNNNHRPLNTHLWRSCEAKFIENASLQSKANSKIECSC